MSSPINEPHHYNEMIEKSKAESAANLKRIFITCVIIAAIIGIIIGGIKLHEWLNKPKSEPEPEPSLVPKSAS